MISMILAFTMCSVLSAFELCLMPYLTEKNLEEHTITTHYGYPALTGIAITTVVCYFCFNQFHQTQTSPTVSDRSFLFISLMLGIIGSVFMLRYGNTESIQQNVGLCFISVSLVIGFKSMMDLYAKIIGVEDNLI